MKRRLFRLGFPSVLVAAVLLAAILPAAVGYSDESSDAAPSVRAPSSLSTAVGSDEVTPLMRERLSEGAAPEEDSASAKPLPSMPNGDSGDSLHATFFAPSEPLPAMPVAGTLDSANEDDFYSWNLAAGQTAYVSLTGAAGTDFDIYLFRSDGSLIGKSDKTTYPDGFALTVLSGSGTYYIGVHRYSGDGEYELIYGVDTDSHRPGTRLLLPGAPVYGMLDGQTDWVDYFNVYVFAGQTFSATLDTPVGGDFDLVLVDSGGGVLASTSSQSGTTKHLSYKAPTSKTYYLAALAGSTTSGSGWYNLSYSRALKAGRFRPVLYTSRSKLRVGRTMKYWGTVYPNCFARYRMVQVQKRKNGRWVHARWVKLDSNGRFPAVRASYSRRTTQYIRLYMPAYVDKVRGINYKHAYSAARRVRWY